MGNTVELVADVGVAGIHRLLAQQHSLQSARVLIVCAGMEGALPTVVGGLVNAPVIAVPTSVGYGASFGGVAALLGMLNTCSPNVSRGQHRQRLRRGVHRHADQPALNRWPFLPRVILGRASETRDTRRATPTRLPASAVRSRPMR